MDAPTSAPRRRWSLADWLVVIVIVAALAALGWWLRPSPQPQPAVVHELVDPTPAPAAAPEPAPIAPPAVAPAPAAAPAVAAEAPAAGVQRLAFSVPETALAERMPPFTAVEEPTPARAVFTLAADPGFSGRVVDVPEGLMAEVEVGVLAIEGMYWVDGSLWRWQPVAADGSFTIADAGTSREPRVIAARAPGHPISYFRRQFPARQGATGIELPLERGIACTLDASVDGTPVTGFLQVEPISYRAADDGTRLPHVGLGMQRTDRAQAAPLTVILPPFPIALFVRAQGAGPSWFVVDPRAGSDLRLALVPEVVLTLTITRGGAAQAGADYSSYNNAVPFSYAGGRTDADGRIVLGGLAPGFYDAWVRGASRVLAVGRGGPVELTWDLDAATP